MKIPFSIIFMITEQCNCNCSFCSRNNLDRSCDNPDLNYVKYAFQILRKEFPTAKLILSGGEPTLSKNFQSIVKFSTNIFDKIELQTNGTYIKEIADFLKPYMKKNLYVQFSLDGLQNIHNNIRGEGVFEQVIYNIEYLSEVHDHISIASTITKDNINEYKSLAMYLNDLKFKRLTISIEQPCNPQKDMITNSEWNMFVDNLLPICHYRVDIAKLYAFDMMDRFLESGQKWLGITNCGRGKTHFYVKSNFDVLPCTCVPHIVGNLLKDDIKIIHQRLNDSYKIKVSESSVCYKCQYLSICNGGCPGLSTKVFGVPNMGDIRCPKVYQEVCRLELL